MKTWFSPHGTEWEAETYEEALEMERDSLIEQLETYRSALETLVSATMWESEDDARSVRQIARKALAWNPDHPSYDEMGQ